MALIITSIIESLIRGTARLALSAFARLTTFNGDTVIFICEKPAALAVPY